MTHMGLRHVLICNIFALVAMRRVVDTYGDSDRCVHSFQVWKPEQDMITKVRKLEDKCEKMSSYLDHQVMVIKNRMLDEVLVARNLTHRVEKDLLEQKLADVQQNIDIKGVRMDIMDIKGENRKLWEAVERSPGGGGRGQISARGRDRNQNAQITEIADEVEDMGQLVNQLKNGVGDLKAEWLLIKREVHDIQSESLQLKFGQNDMKTDTESLKNDLEGIKSETMRLRTQADDLMSLHEKLKKSISEARGEDLEKRIQMKLDTLNRVTTRMENELSKLGMELPSIKETLEDGLASQGLGAEEISQIISKLPMVQTPRSVDSKNYNPEPKDCHEVYKNGFDTSGVYQIIPVGAPQLDNVYCEMINGTGWTVIQRRLDGTLSFNRRWLEYKFGFGNPYGEFWLGNEMMHRISVQKDYVLRLDMWDWEGNRAVAEYDSFRVSGSEDKYKLKVGECAECSENPGDSLNYHDGMAFSTEDQDNDLFLRNCAQENKGGWWYNSCYSSNFNGIYHTGYYSKSPSAFADGIVWFTWKKTEFYSLKRVEMKIRPYHL